MGNSKKTKQREPGWYDCKETNSDDWTPWFWDGKSWMIEEGSIIQHSEEEINFYDIDPIKLKKSNEIEIKDFYLSLGSAKPKLIIEQELTDKEIIYFLKMDGGIIFKKATVKLVINVKEKRKKKEPS